MLTSSSAPSLSLQWSLYCNLQTPVPANALEVEAEARAIRGVAGVSCPIRAVLDRIIITTSGTALLWLCPLRSHYIPNPGITLLSNDGSRSQIAI